MTTSAKKKGEGSTNALTVVSDATAEVVPAEPTIEWYVAKINAVSRRSGIEQGKWLLDAKAKLPHGKFTEMIEDEEGDLPFSPRTAQYLMVIARNEVLSNPKYSSLLPGAWTVLHELAVIDDKLGAGTLESWIERGIIHRKIKLREVEDMVEREIELKEEAEKEEAKDRPQPHLEYIDYLNSLSDVQAAAALMRLSKDVNNLGLRATLSVSFRQLDEPEPGGSRTIN